MTLGLAQLGKRGEIHGIIFVLLMFTQKPCTIVDVNVWRSWQSGRFYSKGGVLKMDLKLNILLILCELYAFQYI